MGISVEQLSQFENGEREFYPDDLVDFARALYTGTDNLITTLEGEAVADAGYVSLPSDEDEGMQEDPQEAMQDIDLVNMSAEELAAEIASLSPMLKVSLIKVLFELKKSE